MEIYPYGGLWSYLKFHFIDGITKQSVMLLDKTRVDYDSKDKKSEITIKNAKTDGEVNVMLTKFGLNVNPALTNEQRAEQIMNELEK